MHKQDTPSVGFLPWFYWAFAAFFFFSEYFVRVSTSVMANDLMRDFHVGALALGSLSAFFYYAYLGMQIPVGILVDRYGPRRLLIFATAICAAASVWFSHADGVGQASIARFLLGFGSSFAFVGALKLAATWLPQKYLGMLVGITQGLGMLGASVGEAPMSFAVVHWGWRNTMLKIAILFALMSVIALFIRSKKSQQQENDTTPHVWQGLKIVLRNRQTWINALYAGLVFAPTAAFGELWGVNFLTNTTSLDLHHAATGIGMIFIGWTFGGPLIGYISDKMHKRRPVMYMSAAAGFIFVPFVLYYSTMPQWAFMLILFLYGMTNAGLVASYTLCTEINPKAVAGIVLGFTNMASVIIGACLQPILGLLLELQWDGTIVNGTPIYSASSFKLAMSILPVCSLLAFYTVSKIEETFCQSLEQRTAKTG